MSKSIIQRDNIQSTKPSPNEISCLSKHDKGWLALCGFVYDHLCVSGQACACFCSLVPICVTCVSEGTSLEEQVRRIKDIEAIESDSFVPQAFKSSRDDIKVRSVSLSFPAPHFLDLFTLSLIEFPSLRCCAVCPETTQAKSNIPHSVPFVPN